MTKVLKTFMAIIRRWPKQDVARTANDQLGIVLESDKTGIEITAMNGHNEEGEPRHYFTVFGYGKHHFNRALLGTLIVVEGKAPVWRPETDVEIQP